MSRIRAILCAILAAGLLTAPRHHAGADEDEQAARRDVLSLTRATAAYAMLRGRLPAKLADLADRRDELDPVLRALPHEPWGADYHLEIQPGGAYRVLTWGPDGRPDTDDDTRGDLVPADQRLAVVMGGLDDGDPRVRDQCRLCLIVLRRNDDELTESLAQAARDVNRPWRARFLLCDALVERRAVPRLVAMLKVDELRIRTPALAALRRVPEFVDDPGQAGRIRAMLAAWLDKADEPARGVAIEIASEFALKDLMPRIRPLLVRPAGADPGAVRTQLVNAIRAVERFGDCESLPALATLASGDPDETVRQRALGTLHRTAFGARAACAGKFDETAFLGIVERALASDARDLRIEAVRVLYKQPAWMKSMRAQVLGMLESDDRSSGPLRQTALDVMSATDPDALVEGLPRYVHDPYPRVRMAAVTALATNRPKALAGCLIGVLADETRAATFHQALNGLRLYAGRLVGVPEALQADNARNRARLRPALQNLLQGGTAFGQTRAKFVELWTRWLCEDAGSPALADSVLRARGAFWRAAKRGDAEAARTLFEGVPDAVAALMSYERGWLQRRTK